MADEDEMTEPQLNRVRELYEARPPIPPEARLRLDRALRETSPPGRRGPLAWLLERHVVALRPWSAAVAGLALLAIGVWLGRMGPSGRATTTDVLRAPIASTLPIANAPSSRVIQFVLVAPRASSVSLVGDFNGWDEDATPLQCAPDGETWTASIAVTDGRHLYAFVVNGSRWVADPVAPLAPEDGFGTPNSVIVVGAT